jgi:hypothetical protein
MAITIPVTHVAKQKNRRRSPKSTGMSRRPHLPCAGSPYHSKKLPSYGTRLMRLKNCSKIRLSVILLLV